MTDPAQTQATGPVAAPTPSCIRSRRVPGERPATSGAAVDRAAGERPAGSRRSAAREMLDSALAGLRLSCRDRQFVSRLVHWDKRNAESVASLLQRARQAGREEARREGARAAGGRLDEGRPGEGRLAEGRPGEGRLTPRQRELIIAALGDAAEYRRSGAAGEGCWDCEMIPGRRCASHARDNDRARSYAELAALLAGAPTQAELARPMAIAGFRRRTPVAS